MAGSVEPTMLRVPRGEEACLFLAQEGWRECEERETMAVLSPTTGETVGRVAACTREEIDAAIARAQAAVAEWRRRPMVERARLLHRWADLLEQSADPLAELLVREIAKNRKESRDEIARSVDYIRYTAEEGLRLSGEALWSDSFPGQTKKKLSIVGRVPLGVVLAIPPFNYPINLAVTKLAPALMAGNAVVMKPPTQGSLAGLNLVALAWEAGIPRDAVQAVTGPGSVIGDYLVRHPGIHMITFTGSTETGLRIGRQAGTVPLVLELGGKDAAIVLADADLDHAAREIVSGAFAYSGQRCTAVKRVLVVEQVADQLVDRLVPLVQALPVGDPADNATIVPLISRAAADYVWEMTMEAIAQGARALTQPGRSGVLGNLLSPVVLDHVSPQMRVAWEEPFGPVLPVLRVRDPQEAVELANRSEYGLQAAIFTRNIHAAMSLADQLDVGTVQINGRTARGPDHFPFVGTKASGLGVQGARYALLSMTRVKSTVLHL